MDLWETPWIIARNWQETIDEALQLSDEKWWWFSQTDIGVDHVMFKQEYLVTDWVEVFENAG